MHRILDLQVLSFKSVEDKISFLNVYEGNKTIPFEIKRVFTIGVREKTKRGFHAHKACSQILIVLQGECKVSCDDGKERKEVILNKPSKGLLIPPTLWAEQEYEPNTILMVITDRPYEEEDYIRDHEEFLKFRETL